MPSLTSTIPTPPMHERHFSMTIARLHSADIYVSNVVQAVDFYVSKLGVEKRVDEPVDEEGHRWIEVAPRNARTAGTAVNLSCRFGSWSPEEIGGRSRLTFDVDDIAGAVAAFNANVLSFHTGPEEFAYGTYVEVKDPDGNIFGLLQEALGP